MAARPGTYLLLPIGLLQLINDHLDTRPLGEIKMIYENLKVLEPHEVRSPEQGPVKPGLKAVPSDPDGA